MTKIIHSQRLAAHLMAQGFVLIRTEPDRRDNGRNVFIFRKSPELEAALNEFSFKRT